MGLPPVASGFMRRAALSSHTMPFLTVKTWHMKAHAAAKIGIEAIWKVIQDWGERGERVWWQVGEGGNNSKVIFLEVGVYRLRTRLWTFF